MPSSMNTYLNSAAVNRLRVKQKLRTITGGVLSVFFVLGIVLGVIGYNEELRKGLPVYVCTLIPCLLLFWSGLRAGRELELANRYDSIFSQDRDGVVRLLELTRQTGKREQQVLGELERLFRRGLFRGCTLRQGDQPAVLLDSAGVDPGGFVTVVCPHCGASNRLRAGGSGACEYCGGAISGADGSA